MIPPASRGECGICGSSPLLPLFLARDTNFGTTEEEFSVMRCPACGVVQTIPRPPEDAMGGYYPLAYYPVGGLEPAYDRRVIRPAQREKLRLVQQFRSGGDLLDVGCGAGFFVREAAEAGFRAQGIEMSTEAVEYGRRVTGADLASGDLLRSDYPGHSFDVVTLWQVLEHVPRPVETLRKIRAILRPGGILALAVPNFSSVQARLFRGLWYHLEVPRHLYHYTPASLRRLVSQEGFVVLSESHRSREHNWAGILGSIMPVAGGPFALRLARRLLARPASRMLAAGESALHRGGTFTLVCASRP